MRIVAPGGKIIKLSEFHKFAVQALPRARMLSVFAAQPVQTVQRGTHGKLHIELGPLRGKAKAEFDLHNARLNEPSLDRMQKLRSITDGVSDVVGKANAVNTAGVTRMLADPPTEAPRAGSTPQVDYAGAITQIDLWSGPCTSINGNKYMLSAYDAYSTNCEMFVMAKKSGAPAATDRYFNESKARGVRIDRGGVLYRDNEIVLNSADMAAVAAAHDRGTLLCYGLQYTTVSE